MRTYHSLVFIVSLGIFTFGSSAFAAKLSYDTVPVHTTSIIKQIEIPRRIIYLI